MSSRRSASDVERSFDMRCPVRYEQCFPCARAGRASNRKHRGEMMKGRVGTVCVGALLLGTFAAPAQAQVNYYTQGWFTSSTWPTCNAAAPAPGAPLSSTCATPASTLDYAAKAANPGLI